MKKWQIALTYFFVCFGLTVAICIQLKTIDESNLTVTKTLTGNELRDQVLKWKEKYDKATVDLKKSEQKLEEIRQQSTKNDESAISKEEEILPKTGHLFRDENWKVVKEPTETEEGLEERYCLNCLKERQTRVIPKLSHIHNLVKIDEVKATCQKEGTKEYYKCSKI